MKDREIRGRFTVETRAQVMKEHGVPRGWWDFLRHYRQKKMIKAMREQVLEDIDWL